MSSIGGATSSPYSAIEADTDSAAPVGRSNHSALSAAQSYDYADVTPMPMLEVEAAGPQALGSYLYPPPYTAFGVPPQVTKKEPVTSVGILFFTDGIDDFSCSATAVGKHGVLTAGHCVHDGISGADEGWYDGFTFIPAFNGKKPCPGNGCPYGVWDDWFEVWTMTGWAEDEDPNFDAGGVIFWPEDGNKLGVTVGFLDIGTDQPVVEHWNSFGYPGNKNGKQWSCQSSYAYDVDVIGASAPLVGFGCLMREGSSGGPVIRDIYRDTEINGIITARRVGFGQELLTPYFGSWFDELFKVLRKTVPE